MSNLRLSLIGLVLLNIGLVQLSSVYPFIVTGVLLLAGATVASAVELYLHLNKTGKK